MENRFLLKPEEGKVMGVAAGIADMTNSDPTLIRLGIVAATLITGPIAILFYVLTGWLAPTQR